jgi:hypothetical protein
MDAIRDQSNPEHGAGVALESTSEILLRAITLVLATLLASVASLLLTNARCGVSAGGATSQSSYCQALGLPSGPHRLGSVLLIIAIFTLPSLIAVVGSLRAWRAGETRGINRPAGIALAGVALSFGLVLLAHANFVGFGPD